LRETSDRTAGRETGLRRGYRRRQRGDLPRDLRPVGHTRRSTGGCRPVITEAPVGVRPVEPVRAISMAIPLVVAIVFAVVGGAVAHIASGALWGVAFAAGLFVALRLGRIETSL